MEFFIAGITLGVTGFWILVVVTAFVVGALSEERPYSATLVALIAAFLACMWQQVNPIAWSMSNPLTALLCIPAYLMLGVAWGTAKWSLYVKSVRRRVDAAMEKHQSMRRGSELNMWLQSLSEQRLSNDKTPQAADSKSRIIGWMAWWPVSLTWTLLDDPLRRAFEAIYNRMGLVFQKMSDRAFSDVVTPTNQQMK